MKFISESKKVIHELSPILAGLKLGLIVVSWVGVGSAAKWIVEHWYPFTRNLWDILVLSLGLPILDVAIKDSLTALLFFLPLGLTALFALKHSRTSEVANAVRVSAGLLGLIFFFLVTKSALFNLFDLITESPLIGGGFNKDSLLISVGSLIAGVGSGVIVSSNLKRPVVLLVLTIFMAITIYITLLIAIGDSADKLRNEQTVFIVLVLLSLTLWCLQLAFRYTPKKLLISAGAAVSFVLAAFIFELGLVVIDYIESTA